MENILTELGLGHRVHQFRNKQIDVSSFKYIMGPQGNTASMKVLMQDTGCSHTQISEICGKVRQYFP